MLIFGVVVLEKALDDAHVLSVPIQTLFWSKLTQMLFVILAFRIPSF